MVYGFEKESPLSYNKGTNYLYVIHHNSPPAPYLNENQSFVSLTYVKALLGIEIGQVCISWLMKNSLARSKTVFLDF